MNATTLPDPSRQRGRPREFDIESALDKALVVFTERGYHATSISDLTDALELTAGSLYKAFKDKRGVFIAAFDRYRAVRLEIQRRRIDAAKTGRDKLAALLGVFAEAAHGPAGLRGCLTINSAADIALFDDEVAAHIAAAYRFDERVFADLVRLGQQDGTVRTDIDADGAAAALLSMTKGMRIVGKTGRSEAETVAAVATMLAMLT